MVMLKVLLTVLKWPTSFMCGISGRTGNSAGSSKAVNLAINSITHRGPDDQGFYVAPGIELGVARLAIIDIAKGHQPKKILLDKFIWYSMVKFII